MPDQVFGLTAEGIARTAETNRRVLGQLPDTGRRTRRVYTSGGGGAVGNEWIDFTVYQLCPSVPDQAIQAVWATVIGTSCQSSVAIGDVVLVWDTRGCWFNVPVELLATFTGRADLAAAEPGQEVLFCAVTYSLEPCYWKVTSLCCSEESY